MDVSDACRTKSATEGLQKAASASAQATRAASQQVCAISAVPVFVSALDISPSPQGQSMRTCSPKHLVAADNI